MVNSRLIWKRKQELKASRNPKPVVELPKEVHHFSELAGKGPISLALVTKPATVKDENEVKTVTGVKPS